MDLPRYFLVGARPAKAVRMADGGMDIVAFDFATGELVRDMGLLSRLFTPDAEVDSISEADFEASVAELRQQRTREVSS